MCYNERYAIIGESLSHTLSPMIHKQILLAYGLEEATYEVLEVSRKDFGNIREILTKKDIGYANVTIPYKQEIMPFLDEILKDASQIGAVNTIFFEGERLFGENTDLFGVQKTFAQLGFNPKGSKALILGGGGASKAVRAALVRGGAAEILTARRKESIKNENGISYEALSTLPDMDIIINTTPIGMFPKEEVSPVPKEVLSKFRFAFDLVYNPAETEFMRLARETGLEVVGGLSMLIYQAMRAEEVWQGKALPKEISDHILALLMKDIDEYFEQQRNG